MKITLKNIFIQVDFYLVLTIQIGHFTVDNAENKTMMMKSLEGLLHKCDLDTFDAKECQVFLLSPYNKHLHWAHCVIT